MSETNVPDSQDPACGPIQKIHTLVLAPLIRIDVDFGRQRVLVTQNGEPLASASAPAGADRLVVEVRPACSVPVPERLPDGG